MTIADRQKWDQKYADRSARCDPSQLLISLDHFLPRHGRALDLAGGVGRNAIWLASRGLDVTVWDVSKVGLSLARDRAAAAGVPISTQIIDLSEPNFQPRGQFDLVLIIGYLNRPLLGQTHHLLAPRGTLIVIQPTQRNLERHFKPPTDYLLNDGELPSLILQLDIVHYEEGWLADNRHDAVLVATKPS
jgi:2-polyprenyl-3-methyl-5-hydroxy-6-metoxy-1,4-benzoquinol methylase